MSIKAERDLHQDAQDTISRIQAEIEMADTSDPFHNTRLAVLRLAFFVRDVIEADRVLRDELSGREGVGVVLFAAGLFGPFHADHIEIEPDDEGVKSSTLIGVLRAICDSGVSKFLDQSSQ